MKGKQPLIAVIGCTGTGKSKLAVELAKCFNGEIINGDAMQIYRGLPIATNKVTSAEMENIPHHLLDCVDNCSEYTVKNFVSDALAKIADIRSRQKVPVLVGGTHYYIQSLLWEDSLVAKDDPSQITIDETIEYKLNKLAISEQLAKPDAPELYGLLRRIDPSMADKWHDRDYRKIRRSLQVYLETGKPHGEVIALQKAHDTTGESRFNALIFCLHAEWNQLDPRLDGRVEHMIRRGLLQELKDFWNSRHFDGTTDYTRGILQTIGFKEFHGFLSNDSASLLKSTELVKIATRQYARKQVRWLRNMFTPLLNNDDSSHFYVLDCGDFCKWDDCVLSNALKITRLFFETDKRSLPEPSEICEAYSGYFQTAKILNKKDWKKHHCDLCETVSNGAQECGPLYSKRNDGKMELEELTNKLARKEQELQDFQLNSKEYETELEAEIQRYETEKLQWEARRTQLEEENSGLKNRLHSTTIDLNEQISALQAELERVKNSHKEDREKTRELETENDDLESKRRMESSAKEDIESHYNKLVERVALLESELDQKKMLTQDVQHLKDELRDANLEIAVLKQHGNTANFPNSYSNSKINLDGKRSEVPAAKIIQDMMSSVRALEVRLNNCRDIVTPLLSPSSKQ